MKMKRLVVAIAVIAAFASLTLFGCGNNPEDAIRQGLTKELDIVKNLDEATLEELAGDELDEFEAYGLNMKEFMKAYFEGFDYSIGKITVDGDTATAQVTLKIKSYSQFMADFQAAITAYVVQIQSNPALALSLTEEDLMAQMSTIMMDTIKNVPVVETAPITIECKKNGNTWEVTQSADEAIQEAMLNN